MQGGAALCTWDRAPGGPGAPEQRGGRGGLSGVAQPAAAVVKGARGSGYTRCGGGGAAQRRSASACLSANTVSSPLGIPTLSGSLLRGGGFLPEPRLPRAPERPRRTVPVPGSSDTPAPPPPVRVTPVSAQCQVRAGHLKRWEGRGGGARRGGATQEPGDASAPHQGLSGQRAEKHPWQTPLGTRRQSRAPEPRGGARRGAARALLGTRRRSLWPAGAGGGGFAGSSFAPSCFSAFCEPPHSNTWGRQGGPGAGRPSLQGCESPRNLQGLEPRRPPGGRRFVTGTEVRAEGFGPSRLTLGPFSALASRFPAWFPILGRWSCGRTENEVSAPNGCV